MLHISRADQVDPLMIQNFCAQRRYEATLLGEFAQALPTAPHLAQYFLCVMDDEKIIGLCWVGGNIVPLGIPDAAIPLIANEIAYSLRRFSSLVGERSQVFALWEQLQHHLPKPRTIRGNQPLMVMQSPSKLSPDPLVSLSKPSDFDLLYPACVAMFTEEVGYSPEQNGAGYEVRVAQLLREGRSLNRIDDGVVVFKAEIGAIAFDVAQIQGVWVNPQHRQQGLSAPAMAAVVNHTLEHIASSVSLYVNDFNIPAIRSYERVGFEQISTFATILL